MTKRQLGNGGSGWTCSSETRAARALCPVPTARAAAWTSSRRRYCELESWRRGSRTSDEPSDGHLGLLVLDGLIGRRVLVPERGRSLELLGQGDLFRPWKTTRPMTPRPSPA